MQRDSGDKTAAKTTIVVLFKFKLEKYIRMSADVQININ